MVDDLYYGSTCPCCAGIQDANLNISFDEDMLAEVLEEIYNEKVKPAEGEIPRKYYEANREKFEEATAQGMAQSQNPNIADDKEFLKKYRHSIDVFSAFRSHAYAKRLADELYDSEGKLRPFEEWCKATESIQSHFNKNWLQTEYNTAVLRAEQAADWRHFEDNKEDFPCLKWMPTSSATPREQHKAFWDMGLTLPVDDKFWDKHHPGDLWNCKCYLEPTTAEPTPKKRIPKEKDAPKPAKGLESNPGKKAEMYSRNHPYYPQPQTCIWLRIAKGGAEARLGRFFNAEEVKCPGNCNECEVIKKCMEQINKIDKPLPTISPIIERRLKGISNQSEKQKLLKNIQQNTDARIIIETPKAKTRMYEGCQGPESASWERTKKLALDLNNNGIDVTFLAEHRDMTCADAIVKFKGHLIIADFKCSATTKPGTLFNDLDKGYTQASNVVLKLEKMDAGIFKSAIQEFLRKYEERDSPRFENNKIGNMILVNKYGKILELERKDFLNSNYEKKIKGFL
ncbi:MAG: hypothetical protein IKP81_14635 [Paludibacteraceae bacterium]|nr:hypothetical protein [Paludibacteraceae bacterium]